MGPFIPPLPFLSCKVAFKYYLIVQGALQGATNYLSNSTVELNKHTFLSNSTVGFISFTTSIIIGEPTVQLEPYITLHSTVQLNQNTNFSHNLRVDLASSPALVGTRKR